jgi:hypothetical protein
MTAFPLEQEIGEIIDAVTAAQRMLRDGALVELAGLDTAVGKVCEAASHLAAEERAQMAGRLSGLADALDRLALDVANQHQACSRQRAAAAYGGQSTAENGSAQ